jgi:hypothetical protein
LYRVHLLSLKILTDSKKARSRCARRRACCESWNALLLHRIGHSRQRARRMVVMVAAMVERTLHLDQG